jgi:hypothetical protein
VEGGRYPPWFSDLRILKRLAAQILVALDLGGVKQNREFNTGGAQSLAQREVGRESVRAESEALSG